MINNSKVKIHKHSLSDNKQLLIDEYIVDGVTVENAQSPEFGVPRYCVISNELSSTKQIASLKVNEFRDANVSLFIFNNWTEFGIFSVNVQLNFNSDNTERHYLTFELLADLLLWNFNQTFIDYLYEFENLWKVSEIGELIDEGVGSVIKVKIETFLNNETILEEINNSLEKIIEVHYKTLQNINKDGYESAILTFFNFPKELKTSCEQYLLYFAQFLLDLGITATSNLKEEAGKVLFSVTPTDDVEALDKIREALSVYLHLPSSPISDIEYSENFALMRLQQQVRNLQHSQQMAKTEILSARYALGLAQKNIDNQDRIIVRQNSLIENQEKIIEKITSNSIMIDSVEKKQQREEFVEIYEGVRAGESKWLRELTGIGLNLPKLINATVKDTFGKDGEKKSVLGLDEEIENN